MIEHFRKIQIEAENGSSMLNSKCDYFHKRDTTYLKISYRLPSSLSIMAIRMVIVD
jgi:hypothetical protein